MGIKEKAREIISKMTSKNTGAQVWDMSTKESRQRQVKRDFEDAKTEKGPYTANMVENDNYYNNKPYTYRQAQELQEKLGINFTPPVLPLAFTEVESQIDDVIPTFQFTGREGLAPNKAKQRELVAGYVLYNNNIEELNLDNERALNSLGNAFWKVSWDGSIVGSGFKGDLVLGNPDPANIFPDPNAYDIEDCEYLCYAFRAHRRKLRRMFGKIIDEITNDGERSTTEIYENNQNKALANDETMLVIEYWYRDDEGDIACSIQINYIEVKHISKYWATTRLSGNQMYPFVKYGKIPVRKSFWDKGEIDTAKHLFDAANREFITAILNDAFMANDITVYEDEALAEGEEINNTPGAKIKMKPNAIDKIKRLGGVSANSGILQMIEFIKGQVQETNGNYDSSQGKEPVRVTTASGIAQLNEKADARKVVKKAGRTEGFKRLAQLIDWSALEFYNTNRLIMVGAEPGKPKEQMMFNSENLAEQDEQGQPYYPKVDVEVVAGDGIRKSKAFTLQATQELANIAVTPENIGIILSQVDLLDLPNKDAIIQQMMQAVKQQEQLRQPAPPTPPPPKNPAETIEFKDLPPKGKAQLAAQVGIQLGPEDFPVEKEDTHKPLVELTKMQMQQTQIDDKQAHDIQMEQLKHRHAMEMEALRARINQDRGGNGEGQGQGDQAS